MCVCSIIIRNDTGGSGFGNFGETVEFFILLIQSDLFENSFRDYLLPSFDTDRVDAIWCFTSDLASLKIELLLGVEQIYLVKILLFWTVKVSVYVHFYVWVPPFNPAYNTPLYAWVPFFNYAAQFCLVIVSYFVLEVLGVNVQKRRSINNSSVTKFTIMTLNRIPLFNEIGD